MHLISKAKTWAKSLKRDIVALWLAARDARVRGMRKRWPAPLRPTRFRQSI